MGSFSLHTAARCVVVSVGSRQERQRRQCCAQQHAVASTHMLDPMLLLFQHVPCPFSWYKAYGVSPGCLRDWRKPVVLVLPVVVLPPMLTSGRSGCRSSALRTRQAQMHAGPTVVIMPTIHGHLPLPTNPARKTSPGSLQQACFFPAIITALSTSDQSASEVAHECQLTPVPP